MKRENFLSCLIAASLAFCLGFGGAACMATGLGLSVDWPRLVLGCLICACVAAACFRGKRGGLVLAAAWVFYILFLLRDDTFMAQLKSMCNTAMTYYNHGYGIAIPDWIKGAKADDHLLSLLTVAAGVITVTVWTVIRKKTSFPAVLLSLPPLLCCIVVTDTVPDTVWIVTFFAGLVLLLMTQPVRRRAPGEANRLTGLLLLPLAAALFLLSLAAPRQGYETPALANSMTELFARASQHLPYLIETSDGQLILSFGQPVTEEVSLSDSGPRVYLNQAIMEVASNHTGTLYLRGRDYDRYDGLSWTSSGNRSENYVLTELLTSVTGKVTVKMLSRQGLYYLPCYPEEAQTLTGGLAENPDRATEYSFQYRDLRRNWKSDYEGFKNFAAETAPVDSRYLELPEETRKRAETIVDAFSQQSSDLSKALAIGDFVRACADYDVNTDYMPENETDFALWFLERSETGYCVHFASAATVLLRAAGIPARYVEGYTVSLQAGKATVVRDKMAHAWVEYYLPNLGWVILDPTPAARQEADTVTTTAPTDETTLPQSPEETTAPQSATTKPTAQTQTQPSVTGGTGSGSGNAEAPLPGWFVTALWGVVWLTVLAAVIAGQWYLRRQLKLRRMRRGRKNAQALARYREVKLLVKLCGTLVPTELTALAEKARFSQHKLTAEELSRFDAFIADAIDILQSRDWHYRIVYRLIFAAY